MSGNSEEDADSVEGEISTPSSTVQYYTDCVVQRNPSMSTTSRVITEQNNTSTSSTSDIADLPSEASDISYVSSSLEHFQPSSGQHLPLQPFPDTTSLFTIDPDSQVFSADTIQYGTDKMRRGMAEFTELKPTTTAVSLNPSSLSHTQEIIGSGNLYNGNQPDRKVLLYGGAKPPISDPCLSSSVLPTTSVLSFKPPPLSSLSPIKSAAITSGTSSNIHTATSLNDPVLQETTSAYLYSSFNVFDNKPGSSTDIIATHVPSITKPKSIAVNGCTTTFTVNKSKPKSESVTITPPVARISVKAVGQEADSSDSVVKEALGISQYPRASVNRQTQGGSARGHDEIQPDGNTVEISSVQPTHTLCKVCVNDKASGTHYGVSSCEGCKSFFRRSLHNNSYLNFKCSREGKCMVVRMTRNRCQYCRFKKCQEVGMSRDSVRYGRVPPGKRDSRNSEDGEPLLDAQLYEIVERIVRVSASYHALFDTTKDRVCQINRKTYTLIPNDGECTDLRVAMFQELATIIEPQIKRVISFAKTVPGFASFSQPTQLSLLKGGFLPAWLLHINRLFDTKERVLVMPDGCCITKEELDYTLTADVSKYLFNLSQTITSQLKLNDTEIALLTAQTFLNTDNCCKKDDHEVTRAHQKIQEGLKVQLSRKHRDAPDLYDNIGSFMRELNFVVTLFNNQVTKFKSHHFKLPGLFVEIFDLSPF